MLAATAAALFWWEWTGPLVAGVLAIGSGLLMPDRAPDRSRTAVMCAIAAAVAAAIATYFWVEDWPLARLSLYVRLVPGLNKVLVAYPAIGPRGVYSLVVAAFGAAGLLYGCVAHNQFGRSVTRSLAWRAAPLVLAGGVIAALQTRALYRAMNEFAKRSGYNGFAIVELLMLGVLIGAVVVLRVRDRKFLQRG
jgi:hypothetical protein